MTARINDLPDETLDKLFEDLTVEYEEPKQLVVAPVPVTEVDSEVSEKQRVEEIINQFKDFIKAAQEMQAILGEKLQSRRVRVDPAKNPAARDAIRRLFGIDSDTITYDMFKKCLEWKSELIALERKSNYGPGST